MADPVNNFGPLTPEQQAMMQRGVTTETYSPLDFGIGAGAGGIASLIARHLARPAGAAAAGPGATAAITGGMAGGTGGLTYLAGPGIRSQENTMRDAEGQPGGFYGPGGRPPTLASMLQGRGQ